MTEFTAVELRKAFRAIPQEQRDAHQSFAIRVWRALSWLERSEQAVELEDQFIACWIGFNALYGRLDEQNRAWGDREAWRQFLAMVWKLDGEERLRRLLGKRELAVLRLIENKYLYDRFWADPRSSCEHQLRKQLRGMLAKCRTLNMLPVLTTLFERIYVMRLQVFHGASTKGSSLNRRTLTQCTALLRELLPVMIEVMIHRGVEADWGPVCFPPVN